jgi:hypothetical protein
VPAQNKNKKSSVRDSPATALMTLNVFFVERVRVVFIDESVGIKGLVVSRKK